jgi:hypothetical protein
MSSITWIIIVLIVVSILVTVSEVVLRFGILSKEKDRRDDGGVALELRGDFAVERNYTMEELRAWARRLDAREKEAVCGAQYIGTTFAGV